MAKKTKYVRVKVDLILHLEEETETLPSELSNIVAGTCSAVVLHMRKEVGLKTAGFSDGHVEYRLYHPRKRRV
jgi:hypothetical protein